MDFPLDPAFACAYSAAQQPSRVANTTGSLIHNGALAQLGERLHGMQEVSGSIPLGSTIYPANAWINFKFYKIR